MNLEKDLVFILMNLCVDIMPDIMIVQEQIVHQKIAKGQAGHLQAGDWKLTYDNLPLV
jgi:hypothetical protein